MYICMPKFLKEDFNQEVVGTSMQNIRYVCNFWYFTHDDMMNDETLVAKLSMK